MNRIISKLKLSMPAAGAELNADRADAAPNWSRRLIALIVALPLVHVGYWLAWPGLNLAHLGNVLMTPRC
jgi:hypothetical protein